MSGLCSAKEPLGKIKVKVNFHFYYFLTLSMLALAFFGVPDLKLPHGKKPSVPVTRELRASHMIDMFADDQRAGTCSATAIGPHAILTAEHCVKRGETTAVTLDLATEKHEILGAAFDGRDHVILVLGGSPFTAYEKPVLATAFITGETVTIFGDGGREYPPRPLYGKVTNCEDPSDIDSAAAEVCFSLPVIPGDSGSAVYNVHGEIVGCDHLPHRG